MEEQERRMAQRVAELTWRVLQANSRMKHDGYALSLTFYGSNNFLVLEKRRLGTAKQCYSIRAWLDEELPPNNLDTLEMQITKEESKYHIH